MKKTIQALLMLVLVIGFGALIAQTPTTKAVTDSTQKVGDTLKVDSLTLDSLAQADSIAMADSLAKAEAMMTPEQKLCREVAQGLMKIYHETDVSKDRDKLAGTLNGYAEVYRNGFYSNEKAKQVAFTMLKGQCYDEVTRVTDKRFYFGYIDNKFESDIRSLSGKIKEYIVSRKDSILADHNKSVGEIFNSKRALEREIDSLKQEAKKPENQSAQQSYYAQLATLKAESKIQKNILIKANPQDEGFAEKTEKLAALEKTIDSVKALTFTEQITRKNKRLIKTTQFWIAEKNRDIKELYSDESERLATLVSSYLQSEGDYNIDEKFTQLVVDKSPEMLTVLENNIKYKLMNDLFVKFSFFSKYDTISGYRTYRTNVLVVVLLFMILFFYTLMVVKKKKEALFIRRIPGLDAIDDAVGRATEMGKPIIYDSGLGGISNMDTIASMLILKHVSKTVAEFKAEIIFPACDPMVMQTAEEMVATGFLDAGCPEDHKKDNIFFMTSSQFAFAAGLSGLIARKKPATCLHFGQYAAESLLISEAGFNAGAIQVAGSSSVDQIPFFVAACDYTLIGEEIYAGAAYLSREPQIMTNLKLSDYSKVAIVIIFLTGSIILSLNTEWTFLLDLFETH